MNLDELKQNLIDHLRSMDLKEMSMEELRTYADTVRIVNDLFKPDVLAETLKAMTEKTFAPTYPMDRGFVGIPFDDAAKA
jgi:hypothetical protein